jgi:hypothetical protein
MMPDFDELGNLPPGIPPASIAEVGERFGWQSEPRLTMNLQDERELEATREKLRFLEERHDAIRAKPVANDYARELTLRSLRRTINQLKEEIVWAESRSVADARAK